MDAVTAAYESASDRLQGLTLDDFRAAVQRCAVYPVKVQGRIAGALIVNGPEVHACILPWAQRRWIRREHVRILNEIIGRHGYATTSATTEAGRQFVERIGFVKTENGYRKDVPYGH